MSMPARQRYLGVFPVAPTTFDEAGEVDLESQALPRLFDRRGLERHLHPGELLGAVRAQRPRARRADRCGARARGGPGARHRHDDAFQLEDLRRAQPAGRGRGRRHGVVMPPYHGATIRAGEAGLLEFFRMLSDALTIPIMIQDAPVSGTALPAPLLARMAGEIANVAYFKIEVPGAAAKLRDLIALGGEAVEGPWDGEEAITLLADLDAGATGTMPSGAYPDLLRPIVDDHAAGRRDAAAAAYDRVLPLINYENRQCGLLACKVLMREGGVIRSDLARHPIRPLHPATRAGLIEIARRLDPLVLRWGK